MYVAGGAGEVLVTRIIVNSFEMRVRDSWVFESNESS